MSIHVPGDKAAFDEHRNTSRTFSVDPKSLERAMEATASFRRADPRHVEWIEAGAPSIRSEDDHIRWFGKPYDTHRPRRR